MCKYKHVFNSRTDSASKLTKTQMWERVLNEFNAEARGSARNLKSLQVFWKNIKRRTKDVEGEIRRQRYVTGGRPPVSIRVDRIHEEVRDFMGPAAEGMDNPFDSDGQNLLSNTYFITFNAL
ncbi:hypothetical protein R5R35_013727 [Gryllus longicercus]|uniref:Regulatory protein zeste n=1 Tax=Gryllus longicercus TaxID=2509291 RepID=A0AAN9ZBU1_9ORTH